MVGVRLDIGTGDDDLPGPESQFKNCQVGSRELSQSKTDAGPIFQEYTGFDSTSVGGELKDLDSGHLVYGVPVSDIGLGDEGHGVVV